jgi:hypothetical protein
MFPLLSLEKLRLDSLSLLDQSGWLVAARVEAKPLSCIG